MSDDEYKGMDAEPEITERVLANANAFIEVDEHVDDIVAWGEAELDRAYDQVRNARGTLDDYKKVASEVADAVAQKLRTLEKRVAATYSTADKSFDSEQGVSDPHTQ